ncbi:unnamed protein product [Effrenium voratum]|nr:unnamed protein product [Effrenium voratum]
MAGYAAEAPSPAEEEDDFELADANLTADANVPSEGFRKCRREGCSFAVTWHATHCCGRCAHSGLHGPHCEQRGKDAAAAAPARRRCSGKGCSYQATWHPNFCCHACPQGKGHGGKCEQQSFRAGSCASPGCKFQVTWHATHCCQACLDRPGHHGPHCSRVDFSRFDLPGRSRLEDCKPSDQGGSFLDLQFAEAQVLGKRVPLCLDLWLPEGKGPFPCLIFVHGGAWRMGTHKTFLTCKWSELLKPLGFALASVQYRFLQEAPWPASAADVRCAVRSLRQHAEALRLRPQVFVCMGHSAGGQLAALLASREPFLDGDLAHVCTSSASTVQGIISYAGALEGPQNATHGNVLAQTGPWPPVLALHGLADPLLQPRLAEEFVALLRPLGVDAKLVLMPGHGHAFHPRPDAMEAILDFLKRFRA